MSTIKKIFRALGGLLGGLMVGVILSLVLLHLKAHHQVPFPSLGWLAPVVFVCGAIVGAVFPNPTMWFFLLPLSWWLNADDTSAGDIDMNWRELFANVAYLAGLISLVVGVLFSLTIAVALGVIGISVFTYLLFAEDRWQKTIDPHVENHSNA